MIDRIERAAVLLGRVRSLLPRFDATRARTIALVALFALSGVQVLPAVHAVVTQHRTCVEHGEVVHTDDPASGEHRIAQASHEARESEREWTRIGERSTDGETHRHDHCAHVWLGIAAIEGSLPRTLASPALVSDAKRNTALAIVTIASLDIAPKTSPPTA